MTAQRLDSCLRPGDVVARGSGDDFLVLLKDFGGEAGVLRVAETATPAAAAQRPAELIITRFIPIASEGGGRAERRGRPFFCYAGGARSVRR
jgi:GGDEF domain-containing protein